MELLSTSLKKAKEKKTKHSDAILSHDWLKMHIEPSLHENSIVGNRGYVNFKKRINKILEPEKAQRFFDFLQYPFISNELTESIAKELKRALNASDFNIDIDFENDDYQTTFAQHLKKIKDEKFWNSEAWDIYIKRPSSFIVVDLPEQQSTDFPQWYYYEVRPEDVLSYSYESKEYLNWIIFKDSKERIIGIDSQSYYILEDTDKEYRIISQIDHNLGYTPAKNFWNQIKGDDYTFRYNAIIKSLAKLDSLLFWSTSIDYFQSYGVWPITWLYEQSEDSESVNEDVLGRFHPAHEPMDQQQKDLIGAGSIYELPVPTMGEQSLAPPVGFVTIDVSNLEYASKDLRTKELEIYERCVGRDQQPSNKQAMNELQVTSAYESKTNVLTVISAGFSEIREWIYRTGASLMFDLNRANLNIYVDYGTDFYLKGESDLIEKYKNQRESGLPIYYLSQTRDMLTSVISKTNPAERERLRIKSYLEPFPDWSLAELKGTRFENTDEYEIKARFSEFINRFELENGPIEYFGRGNSETTFENRVNIIKQTIKNYVENTSTVGD